MSTPAIPDVDLRERIVAVVRQSKNPLTVKGLAKLVRSKEERVRSELQEPVEAQQIYWWPRNRGVEYLWHVSSEEKAREAMMTAAAGHALSRLDLCKAAAKKTPGVSSKKMEPFLRALVDEGKLKGVPAFVGSSKLFVVAGDREGYFQAARLFVEKKVRLAGFDPSAFFGERASDKPATDVADVPALILEAVRLLEPVRGVPVPTLRLRNHLRQLSKSGFDKAALELRNRQEVFLSRHADPYNISEQDKDLLIDGQDGTYYVGVAIR